MGRLGKKIGRNANFGMQPVVFRSPARPPTPVLLRFLYFSGIESEYYVSNLGGHSVRSFMHVIRPAAQMQWRLPPEQRGSQCSTSFRPPQSLAPGPPVQVAINGQLFVE
jgi:hypothetical protein